jgi:hypothetical protein
MSKFCLRTISGLEVVGGGWGIGLIMWQVLAAPRGAFYIPSVLIVILIYSLCIVAGITLWMGHPCGRNISIVIQIIQLPKLLSPLLIFFFSFGLDFNFYWVLSSEFSNLRINLKLGAYHQLLINQTSAPFGIGVSIPACIFLFKLLKYKPSVNGPDC